MPLSKCNPVCDTHLRQKFPSVEIVLYFLEYPRMTICGTAYHHAVNPISVKVFFCLLRRIYVAVSDNGDAHPRVFLYLSDQGPVCFSLVHLAACASVNSKRLNADILQPFCEFNYDFRVLVPSKAGLYGNRQLDCFHHLSGDFDHLVRFSHHPRAGTAACYLADRTSEIDVYKVRSMSACNLCRLLRHLRRIYHRLRNVAVNLDSDRRFVVICDQFFKRLACIADESVRRDELCVHHVCTELLADEPEGCVGHVLHRCQKQRLVA